MHMRLNFGRDTIILQNAERIIVPERQWQLVVLSFAVSWLGSYTTCQILSHANSLGKGGEWHLWVIAASVVFGFVAIWCLHFIAVLSVSLDVSVGLDVGLTVLSALVATLFTFAAFSSDSGGSRKHGWWHQVGKSPWTKTFVRKRRAKKQTDEQREAEEGLLARRASDDLSAADINSQYMESATAVLKDDAEVVERGRQIAGEAEIDEDIIRAAGLDEEEEREDLPGEDIADGDDGPSISRRGSSENEVVDWERRSGVSTPSSSGVNGAGANGVVPHPKPTTAQLAARRRSSSGSATSQSGGWTSSPTSSEHDFSNSGGEMTLSMNRTAKRRLMSGAYRAPLSIKAFVIEIWDGISWFIAFKGLVWAIALISMHNLGIAAMQIPLGRVEFDVRYNIAAAIVAFIVTCVACICIRNMEVQFSRQVLFSTVAASGVFAFHYTSVAGATYISGMPPDPDPSASGYPTELPFVIVVLAIMTCVIASGLLAHNATLSRNRLAELVLTKRRMWRVIAEKEAVDRAAEVKQQFISVASHELRTPLFSVTGYAELLARTDLSDEQTLYIKNVLNACSSMNLIISNVLDFSKLERGNAESSAKPVCVDLRKMLEGLTRMTEDRGINSGYPGVDIIVAVAKDVPETLFVDEAYVTRVLMNLLSNALKFTQHGYIQVYVELEKEGLVIKVSDTGSGIPKRFRRALFEPYRQADSTLTRPHQGTGLGLSICKQLVQRLAGTIEVSSIEGQGTTFIVSLPIGSPSDPPVPPLTNGSSKPTRIALAYRDHQTHDIITSLLSSYGFTVVSAHGLSAQEIKSSSDFVWCDAETVGTHSELRKLFSSGTAEESKFPILITSSGFDLESCEGFEASTNTIIVRGPGIILHRILKMMETPSEHYRTPVPIVQPKVLRFAELPLPSKANISRAASPIPTIPKRCVMVVEDNAVNRALGKKILEKLGYEAVTAENGEEAVAQARKEKAEVILMDCQMPVMDGHEATRAIRALEADGTFKRRTWIIALTANVTRAAENRCKEDGFDLFLAKPLNLAQLKEALDKYLSPVEP